MAKRWLRITAYMAALVTVIVGGVIWEDHRRKSDSPIRYPLGIKFVLTEEIPAHAPRIEVGQSVSLDLAQTLEGECDLRIEGGGAEGVIESVDKSGDMIRVRVVAIQYRNTRIRIIGDLIGRPSVVQLGQFATPETSAFVPKYASFIAYMQPGELANTLAQITRNWGGRMPGCVPMTKSEREKKYGF